MADDSSITPRTLIREYVDNTEGSKSVLVARRRRSLRKSPVKRTSQSMIEERSRRSSVARRRSSFSEETPKSMIQRFLDAHETGKPVSRKRQLVDDDERGIEEAELTKSRRVHLPSIETPGKHLTPRTVISGFLRQALIETPIQSERHSNNQTLPPVPPEAELRLADSPFDANSSARPRRSPHKTNALHTTQHTAKFDFTLRSIAEDEESDIVIPETQADRNVSRRRSSVAERRTHTHPEGVDEDLDEHGEPADDDDIPLGESPIKGVPEEAMDGDSDSSDHSGPVTRERRTRSYSNIYQGEVKGGNSSRRKTVGDHRDLQNVSIKDKDPVRRKSAMAEDIPSISPGSRSFKDARTNRKTDRLANIDSEATSDNETNKENNTSRMKRNNQTTPSRGDGGRRSLTRRDTYMNDSGNSLEENSRDQVDGILRSNRNSTHRTGSEHLDDTSRRDRFMKRRQNEQSMHLDDSPNNITEDGSKRKSRNQSINGDNIPGGSIHDGSVRKSRNQSINGDNIPGGSIQDGSIRKSRNQSINGDNIAEGSIQDGSVRKSRNQSINGDNIPGGSIQDGSVRKSRNQSINGDNIPGGSIQDGSVRKSRNQSINGDNIPGGSIHDGSIRKSRNQSINGDNIAEGSIQDGSVRKSRNQSINGDNIPGGSIQDGSVRKSRNQSINGDNIPGGSIQDGSVRKSRNQSINGDNIPGGSIHDGSVRKSRNQSINGDNIPGGSIHDGSVRKPRNQSINGDNIPGGSIHDGSVRKPRNQSINGDNIPGGSIHDGSVRKSRNQSINGDNIPGGSIQDRSVRKPRNQSINGDNIPGGSIHDGSVRKPRNQSINGDNISEDDELSRVDGLQLQNDTVPASILHESTDPPDTEGSESDPNTPDPATGSHRKASTDHHTLTLSTNRPHKTPTGGNQLTPGSSKTHHKSQARLEDFLPVGSSNSQPQPMTSATVEEIVSDSEDDDENNRNRQYIPVKTPQTVRVKRKDLPVTPLSVNRIAQSKHMTSTPKPQGKQKVVNSTKKAVVKKAVKKTVMRERMPASLTKGIFSHFLKSSVSKEVMVEVEKAADKFWSTIASDIDAYTHHAGRHIVSTQDVELLMRRQRFITEKRSMFTLVDQYLPLEYRQEIIPIARSGNKVAPPF